MSDSAHFSQLLWPVKSSDSMHDLLFLVLFRLISPHAMAGTVYQFPPSVKERSGDTVTMHCQLNEVQSFCHTVAWVRVNPVSGIIDILQDANIPPQTKDEVENPVCQASIYNATVQDSGTYYCIATDREHMYLGNGTAVTLHADSTVMPSVDIVAFASSNNHSTVTLQCTVRGSAPSQVFVYWLIGSRKENGQTLVVWEEGEENSVKTQNNVAVSAEEWKIEGQSTCVVKFGGWMFNTTLHHYDIQDTCYPLVGVTRFFALVAALLFFITSLILAGRF
ncbi:Ig heavy chain C region isoform X3 [Rhinichthys klamathensis goyatoka]|uniref:Ig heavy chain C region isoform X3 n=1 Tax=Rhinichthys klamathensis goyatoka TaxID=3034132 RepID=UPI0024B57FF3|nr:Ig heavy chain C region isoform X3 [Rhinichthys klamathensis goyatoka]